MLRGAFWGASAWVLAAIAAFTGRPTLAAEFRSTFDKTPDRIWVGREYWANPMEDWRIAAGRVECTTGGGNREIHLLTRQLGSKPGTLEMSVRFGLLAKGKGTAGFRIGIRDNEVDDYRAWLIYGSGINAGVTTDGAIFLAGKRKANAVPPAALQDAVLKLSVKPLADGGDAARLAIHKPDGTRLAEIATTLPKGKLRAGNLALVNNHFGNKKKRRGGARFWFKQWEVAGTRVEDHDDRAFGPVCWTMHTLSRGVLKLTAQMPPVGAGDNQHVELQVQRNGKWVTIAKSKIAPLSYTATFRVANWNSGNDVPYRVVYAEKRNGGADRPGVWQGVIRKDPVGKRELVVAAFTGNADYAFPNLQVVKNVRHLDPDVLFFSGDQIYEYVGGYGLIREPVVPACLNYLRKWYLVGLAFGDLMRDRVTVCIPDDHDVYQGNIWGNGGNAVILRLHEAGGYVQHPDFVNCVHRTQCSHLPDPFDPRPIEQNISVYYAPMVYGRVSFAIIADRMFKSGPRWVATWKGRPDHLKDPKYDLRRLDKPGLELLGERQEKFLEQWGADWRGADFHCVLSQTNFCNVANYHGPRREYLVADLDSGGWPQTARNRAVDLMRRGFAFHLCGDQHLATIVHYGIAHPGDAGYSFCVPSIANFYPRRWIPDEEGRPVKNRPKGGLPNTGDYRDGLGHPTRVVAVGNPEEKYRKGRILSLHDKASGFGIVRFDKQARTITIECYRLLADVTDGDTRGDQFPGWPKRIHLLDNYARKPTGYLPTVNVVGMVDPVIQVIDESTGRIEYTVRIQGQSFRPMVFGPGPFTIHVGEPGTNRLRTFRSVPPVTKGEALGAIFPDAGR